MPDRARPFLAAVVLSLLALPATAARTRVDCTPLLNDAEDSYAAGLLDEARNYVEACLGNRPPENFRILSLALLAKVQLAEDNVAGAQETVTEILRLEPDYLPDPRDPPRLRALIDETRGDRQEVKVSSVSKSPESLREAPATVEVLTAEEIARRGYLDLEAVLHDLPGFNISRGNGTIYSNIYQRGFRSNSTERTLFLVDGVEHNDLFTNIAWITRQYPLSSIDRVEVIYGPASTMYGANAFTGVINVITKTPEQYLEGRSEGDRVRRRDPEADGEGEGGQAQRHLAIDAEVGGGSFGTHWVDATVAGRTRGGGLLFSVTSRIYRSDEPDLSAFPDWDYDGEAFVGDPGNYQALGDQGGDAELAKELDRQAANGLLGGRPVGFSDLTDDWYVSAKLKIQDVELGVQTWQRREGATPWYTEAARPGADNGFTNIQEQTAFYVRFGREIARDLSLVFFSRFKRHGTDPDSSTFALQSYGNGTLSLEDLAAGQPAYFQQTRLLRSSNQLRNELTLIYAPSARLSLVTGVELRDGSIQVDNVREKNTIPGEVPPVPETLNAEKSDVRDLGVFAQISYRLRPRLKLVAGGRWDNNKIEPRGGFGTVFNPRLAVVWSPGDFTYKAVYAEAFKDATNFNRFATIDGTREADNPDLKPEEAKNLELSASWQVEGRKLEVSAFETTYSQVIGIGTAPSPLTGLPTQQFQNQGAFEIRGIQASGRFELGRFDVYANYTYIDPVNTEPVDDQGQPRTDVAELRVGDIAAHQLNVGLFTRLGDKLEIDARVNFVDDRPTGKGTTVETNPNRAIDGYTVVGAAATWKNLVPGVDLQLVIHNLFDETYTDPGVRSAGSGFAAELPQPGRSLFGRVKLRF